LLTDLADLTDNNYREERKDAKRIVCIS